MTVPSDTTYLVKRDLFEAVRLCSQHLLWQLHTKYLLNHVIPIQDGMAIADIGAGTGIWATEVAPHLPPSARVTAFDVADTHFPAQEYWPPNVTFDLLNIFQDILSSLIGQFDVVHIRLWAFIIRGNDPSLLIQNAAKMLKPGGYLQWEDARMLNRVVRGNAATEVSHMLSCLTSATRIDFRWLEELDKSVKRAEPNLEVVECQQKPWSAELVPLCFQTWISSFENNAALFDQMKQAVSSVPSSKEWLDAIERLQKDKSGQLHWQPVTLLARKSG
ncbi:hypothetical protein N7488_005557 [Penicillium malachiteum]|nr:hypothetical protein N7488_005557 [Penicillium malachiteum]